jgi:hypothetical protein
MPLTGPGTATKYSILWACQVCSLSVFSLLPLSSCSNLFPSLTSAHLASFLFLSTSPFVAPSPAWLAHFACPVRRLVRVCTCYSRPHSLYNKFVLVCPVPVYVSLSPPLFTRLVSAFSLSTWPFKLFFRTTTWWCASLYFSCTSVRPCLVGFRRACPTRSVFGRPSLMPGSSTPTRFFQPFF